MAADAPAPLLRKAAKFTAAGKSRVRFDSSKNRWKYIDNDNKTGQFVVVFNVKSNVYEVKTGTTKRNRDILATNSTLAGALAEARSLAEGKAGLSRGYRFGVSRRDDSTEI